MSCATSHKRCCAVCCVCLICFSTSCVPSSLCLRMFHSGGFFFSLFAVAFLLTPWRTQADLISSLLWFYFTHDASGSFSPSTDSSSAGCPAHDARVCQSGNFPTLKAHSTIINSTHDFVAGKWRHAANIDSRKKKTTKYIRTIIEIIWLVVWWPCSSGRKQRVCHHHFGLLA